MWPVAIVGLKVAAGQARFCCACVNRREPVDGVPVTLAMVHAFAASLRLAGKLGELLGPGKLLDPALKPADGAFALFAELDASCKLFVDPARMSMVRPAAVLSRRGPRDPRAPPPLLTYPSRTLRSRCASSTSCCAPPAA